MDPFSDAELMAISKALAAEIGDIRSAHDPDFGRGRSVLHALDNGAP